MPGPQHRTAARAGSVTRDDVADVHVTPSRHRAPAGDPPAPFAEGREAGAGVGTEGPAPGRVRGHVPAGARGARTVAAALAAALLAGLAVAWLTRPQQSARPAGSEGIRSVTAPSSAPGAPAARAPAAGASPSEPSSTLVSARPATVPAVPADGRQGMPEQLTIQRLGIDMTVVPQGVARDGEMALPATPAQVGWYRYGPRPGDRAGATVLAAHLDMPGYGIGPIAKVEDLRAGDVITVRSAATTHRFRVTGVASVRKTSLDLAALFARDGPPRLHVVTCGGEFDRERRRYDENVVVTAVPMT